jgi:hypothetical protein
MQFSRLAVFATLLIATATTVLAQRTISSITAGNGDGGLATNTSFHAPGGLAFDTAGNLYVSDQYLHVVRRITPGGTISTYAGTGAPGFSGDGGAATAATLYEPRGLAVDSSGNLYIADAANFRIRRVTPGGVISTFAGIGPGSGPVGENGPATAAFLGYPLALAVDAVGNVYVSLNYDGTVRRITPAGVISTFVSVGAIIFGMSCDSTGNLYMADPGGRLIRRVTPAGVMTTIAGNGLETFVPGAAPTATGIGNPAAVAVDSSGNIAFSSFFDRQPIYRLATTNVLQILSGAIGEGGNTGDGGPLGDARFSAIGALIYDPAGNLYVACGDRIRRITPAGVISTIAGGFLGEGGPASNFRAVFPSWVASDASGALLLPDLSNRLRRIAAGNITTAAGNGGLPLAAGPGEGSSAILAAIGMPTAGTYDSNGNIYFAAASRIFRITPTGQLNRVAGTGVANSLSDGQPALSATVDRVGSMAIDSAGILYFSDYGRGRYITTAGVMSSFASSATAVAVDSADNLIYSTGLGGTIIRRARIGNSFGTTVIGGTGVPGFSGDGGPATQAQFYDPSGIAVDSVGNIYIADPVTHRIRRIAPNGIVTTFAGSGPTGNSGQTAYPDSFSGDGGPATQARLNSPSGVAVDAAGNVYIADRNNHRLRKVASGGPDPVLTTFTTNPAGLQVTVDGALYTTPAAIALVTGSTVSIGAPNQNLPFTSTSRYSFGSWSDGGAATHNITVGATAAAYTASFVTQHRVDFADSPSLGFTITPTPASSDGFYTMGTTIQVLATVPPGSSFRNFTGSAQRFDNPASFTVNSYSSIGADIYCQLTLTNASATVGAGAGTLTLPFSSPLVPQCDPDTLFRDNWASRASSTTGVVVNYLANPGAPRSMVIYVGAERFTLIQAGASNFPTVDATGPISASGSNQTLIFRFNHAEGFANLGVVNVLVNRALDGGNACYIAYSQPAGILFLVNDAGPDAGVSAPLVLGSSNTVSNSQCTIRGTGSSAVGAGTTLTLTLNMSFASGFGGSRVIYAAARNTTDTGNSGWSAIGNTQVPETSTTFPLTGPMTPATVSTAAQIVSLTYSDATSASNVTTGWMLINSALDARGACYIAYFAPANLIFLYPDSGDGTVARTMVLAGTNTVENGQCRISSQGSSTATSAGRLTLNLNVTMKASFLGPKGVWTALQTATNQVSPWRIVGSWLAP